MMPIEKRLSVSLFGNGLLVVSVEADLICRYLEVKMIDEATHCDIEVEYN